MNPLELTGAVTALANAITCRLTTEEATLLASILVQLGDTIVTVVTHQGLCESNNPCTP